MQSKETVERRLEERGDFIENARYFSCTKLLYAIGIWDAPVMNVYKIPSDKAEDCRKCDAGQPCVLHDNFICDKKMYKLTEVKK